MKAFWFEPSAAGMDLRAREVSPPVPKAGQILVRMRAAALNRGSLRARPHLHDAHPEARPAGNEGAGEVVELGADVAGFAVGDRVMGVCPGAFAEFALMEARTAVRAPEVLSWEEAACTTLVYTVVHDMLIAQGRLKSGEWVLVTAASSGVGVAAVQLAKALGAGTIGTSGSQAKLDKLMRLGLDVGVATRGPAFLDAAMTATGGKGVDLIVNGVGGSVFAECIRALAFEGRLATVGYLDDVLESSVDLAKVHASRLTIFGVSAAQRTAAQRAAATQGFVRDVLPLIAAGRIRPYIDRVFDFADLPAAKAHMEANAHVGKIAVAIS